MPIFCQGRTWGSSNLHLTEMGRCYLATLIKIFCEKVLIRDNVIAETVAHRSNSSTDRDDLVNRLEGLEDRLATLERQSNRTGT